MNTPGGNTIATAELTFTHMLCGTRPIVRGASGMKEGKWERKLLKVRNWGKTWQFWGLAESVWRGCQAGTCFRNESYCLRPLSH